MQLPSRLSGIFEGAINGQAPSREDCVYLLTFPEDSLEANLLIGVADFVSRRRFGNQTVLLR